MIDLEENLSPARARLAAVVSNGGDVIDVGDAAAALDMSRPQTAKILSRWEKQGWLRRIARGKYVPVELELLGAPNVICDPWVMVPALFGPAYVGGRTAAEHWGLTDQMFRDIVVCTARPTRKKTVERHNTVYTLKRVREEMIFGTTRLWRSRTSVLVSDPHRTIIDIMDDPAFGGGIVHATDCFDSYLRSEHRDIGKLVDYADRLGNGAVFKRLGFLAERRPLAEDLAEAAKLRLTEGHAKLDPALECGRLITRWRLRVPENFAEGFWR